MKVLVVSFVLALALLVGACEGHGYIHKSRAHLCTANQHALNRDCGYVQYEPQSVEGAKGFPASGPKDGHIASGGLADFHKLDDFGADRWTAVPIANFTTGKSNGKLKLSFPWTLTAPHRTTSFEYFISKKEYNPNAVLTRAQLVLEPFCADAIHNGAIPGNDYVTENCELDAAGYSGTHVILGVWTIDDTINAFYQVIDVKFDGSNDNPNMWNNGKPNSDSAAMCVSIILGLVLGFLNVLFSYH